MLVSIATCAQAEGGHGVFSSDSSSGTFLDSSYLFRWRHHARADSY